MFGNKTLFKNSIFNILYRLLNVVFPLITSVYVSRVILAEGVGKVSFANNIVSYFTLVAVLGITSYGPREIGKCDHNSERINKVFSELFTINLISTIACSIIYVILIFTIDRFNENILLYLICGIPLFFNCINVDWFYQGIEEYGYITIRSFIVKIFSFASLFIFVKSQSDFLIYALINALALAVNYIFNIFHLRNKVSFSINNLNLKQHLKPVFILLSSSIAVELYTAVDITMLGFWCDDNIVGYYSNANKIVRIVQALITSISSVMLPRTSLFFANKDYEKFNQLFSKVIKLLCGLAFPAAAGLFILSNTIVITLYGQEFSESIITLQILSLTLPTLVLNALYGFQVLVASGNEKKYMIMVIVGAIVNLSLNPIFIHFYNHNGAAFASLLSELVVCIVAILFSRKYAKVKIDLKYIFSLIISLSGMILSVYFLNQTEISLIVKLILCIGVGMAVYFGLLFITKNEIANYAISKIKLKK